MTRNPWAMNEQTAAIIKLKEFADEANGFMRLYLIRHDNKEIGPAVMRREPLAVTLAITISHALRGMAGSGRRCTSCEHMFTFDPPHAFLVWMPDTNDDKRPENLIAQGVCSECCRHKNDEQLLQDALVYIRTIFPDTEEVTEASEFIDEQATH